MSDESEKKITGMTVRLNTARAGVFDDSLSGLRLDIFGKGTESGVIPDCEEEKLDVIRKAIKCGILLLDNQIAKQDDRRTNIVDNSANINKECADLLLRTRKTLQADIRKVTDAKRLTILLDLEEKGKNRLSIIRVIKKKLNSISSGPQIKVEEVEAEYQIKNITETTGENPTA